MTRRAQGLAASTALRRAAPGGRRGQRGARAPPHHTYRSGGCPRWRGSAARRRSGRGNLRTRPGWKPWPPTVTRQRSPVPQARAGRFRQRSADPRHVAARRRTAPAQLPRPSAPARGVRASLRDGCLPPQNGGGRACSLAFASVGYASSRRSDLRVPNNTLKMANRPIALLPGLGVRADTARLAGPVHLCSANGFCTLPFCRVELCM